MVALILSRLAFGVKKIGNRRSAQHNRFPQDILQRAPQHLSFFPAQPGSQPRWMNFRSPQALVRIDIAHAAQHTLVQKESLDPRAPSANPVREFFRAYFERIGAESRQLLGKQCFGQVGDAPKTPRVGVAQFTPIIQEHADMRMFFKWLPRRSRRDMAGHPQMHEQRSRRRVSICRRAGVSIHRREPQQHELAVTLDRFDLAPRQVLLQRGRIVDKIRFAQRDGNNPAAENCLPQSACYRFDFGKFRHQLTNTSK